MKGRELGATTGGRGRRHVCPEGVFTPLITPLITPLKRPFYSLFSEHPRVGDASVMLNEDMGSSGNHVCSSLVTSIFATARSAAAHGGG